MPTLIFPDENSRAAAADLQEALEDAAIVETVLREHELRVLGQLSIGPDEVRQVAEESATIMRRIGEALPPSLTKGRTAGGPSFWECYGESFRSWAIAPLLANALIARRAAEELGGTHAVVIENPSASGWWSYRQQVLEAVSAGLSEAGVELRARPTWLLRAVRGFVAGCMGAWAAGAVRTLGAGRGLRQWRAQPRPAPPQPADVLFLAVGSTSVPIIDRLASQLGERHGLSCAAVTLYADDVGMERQSRSGVPYHYINRFHNQGLSAPNALTHQGQVFFGWPWWFARACRNAPKAELGRLWPGIRNRLLIALARDSQQMLADMTAAERILDSYRPKTLVAIHLCADRVAPLILSARARGIPVLYLQHGVYLAKDDCTSPLPYDEYMVFGEAAAESLRPRAEDAPITAVGHCLYDDLAAATRGPSEAARKLKGDAKALALIATQPDETDVYDVDSERWWVRGVVEACRELGARAVIKLHPADVEVGMYERLAREMPGVVTVLRHGEHELNELLAAADALVTRDSTVVIEANLLGVPVVTVNLTGRQDRFPFAADGGARGVYSYEDLLPAMREAIEAGPDAETPSRQAFLTRHAGPTDGGATERIVETIARYG